MVIDRAVTFQSAIAGLLPIAADRLSCARPNVFRRESAALAEDTSHELIEVVTPKR